MRDDADDWRIPGFLYAELICEEGPIYRIELIRRIFAELNKASIPHANDRQAEITVSKWEKGGKLVRQDP